MKKTIIRFLISAGLLAFVSTLTVPTLVAADAGALLNPGIRRVDHAGQFVIGQHAGGQIGAAAGDDRSKYRHDIGTSSSSAGSLKAASISSSEPLRALERSCLIFWTTAIA